VTPLRIAVVGLGYWGPNLARNLQELECAELVAICDSNPTRLEQIGRRFSGVQRWTSFDEVLSDESVDAVAIATPVSSHFPLGMRALQAGKHVFIEKPLAASVEECLALIQFAEEKGLVVMPGHTFLYSPPVVAIRNLIASGSLGEIYFISTNRVNLGLHQPDVSVAWDLGPHDFSILQYWLGEAPMSVSAFTRGFVVSTIPDVAFIDLEFPSRTIAHVELSWLAPSKLRRTTIVGSEKMVVYDDTSTEPVRIFDSGVVLKEPESFGEFQLSYRTGDIVSPRIEATEPLALELRDFCDAARTGSTPRSSHQIGLEVVRMIEAVDQSSELGGAKVAIGELDPLTLAAAADSSTISRRKRRAYQARPCPSRSQPFSSSSSAIASIRATSRFVSLGTVRPRSHRNEGERASSRYLLPSNQTATNSPET
jgi:predicted dehydrogenase